MCNFARYWTKDRRAHTRGRAYRYRQKVFNIGDYKFDIKGVLIAETGKGYPDDDVYRLRMLFESTSPVQLVNAVSDLFMDGTRNVCITDIEFPDVQGKELRCRPFTLSCETDNVTSLIQA